jgi:hypothetical protein
VSLAGVGKGRERCALSGCTNVPTRVVKRANLRANLRANRTWHSSSLMETLSVIKRKHIRGVTLIRMLIEGSLRCLNSGHTSSVRRRADAR